VQNIIGSRGRRYLGVAFPNNNKYVLHRGAVKVWQYLDKKHCTLSRVGTVQRPKKIIQLHDWLACGMLGDILEGPGKNSTKIMVNDATNRYHPSTASFDFSVAIRLAG
jgi:hypothetical protein